MSSLKVYIERKAYRKFRYFIDICEDEISGFGKVVKRDGRLIVTDFQIFKQSVSGAHSDMDEDALASFLYEQIKAGESMSEWRVWWHSHARMAAFFSQTDTGTIDRSNEFPWLISLVGNHDGDLKARIDVFDPIRCEEEIEVEVIEEEDPELKALCEKEIKEKVTRSVNFYLPKKGGEKKHKGEIKFWGEGEDDEDWHEHMRK